MPHLPSAPACPRITILTFLSCLSPPILLVAVPNPIFVPVTAANTSPLSLQIAMYTSSLLEAHSDSTWQTQLCQRSGEPVSVFVLDRRVGRRTCAWHMGYLTAARPRTAEVQRMPSLGQMIVLNIEPTRNEAVGVIAVSQLSACRLRGLSPRPIPGGPRPPQRLARSAGFYTCGELIIVDGDCPSRLITFYRSQSAAQPRRRTAPPTGVYIEGPPESWSANRPASTRYWADVCGISGTAVSGALRHITPLRRPDDSWLLHNLAP